MGIIQKISNVALKPSVFLGNIATKGLSLVTGKTYGTTTSQELSNTTAGKILGTAIAGTAAALAVALVPAGTTATALSKGGSVAKSAGTTIKNAAVTYAKANPIKTTLGVLGITPIVAGAVISQPKETAQTLIQTPGNLFNFGGNAADILTSKNLTDAGTNIKKTFEENPGISSAFVLGGITAAAIPLINAFTSAQNRNAIQEQTKAIQEQTKTILDGKIPETIPTPAPNTATGSPVTASNAGVILPQTTDITKTATKRAKNKSYKTPGQMINNAVRVNIINSYSPHRTTKKYLNTIKLVN